MRPPPSLDTNPKPYIGLTHPQRLVGRRVKALASREHVVGARARGIRVVPGDGGERAVGVDGVCSARAGVASTTGAQAKLNAAERINAQSSVNAQSRDLST